MKSFIKMLMMVILSLSFVFSFPISVFAYEYGELNLDEMIEVRKIGEREITSISADNVNRIRISKSRSYRNKTEKERAEDIF